MNKLENDFDMQITHIEKEILEVGRFL